MTSAKFEQNFWGEGNHGFEVLLQNLKAGIAASKELGEFIKERASVEDVYAKGISKLHKTISHVPEATLGAFAPLLQVLRDMCEQLSSIHGQFVEMLTELSREIFEYNITQRDKLKSNQKGEIEIAQESLQSFTSCDAALQKSKKLYQQSCDQLNKLKGKLEKSKADPGTNPKAKQQLEGRVKQAETWQGTMKGDHQAAVQRHCDHLMEFQGKMAEAALKFESLEEEHLAQMVTFMIKISQAQDNGHVRVERVFATVNEQLNALSVEKLMKQFVESKGTGREKPVPFKFRLIPIDDSTPSITLSASQDNLETASVRTSSKGEKTLRQRFKKKLGLTAKAATVDPSVNGPVGTATLQPEAEAHTPEVDEEGYSIRPQDAASISHFPDEPGENQEDSDSDSDFESETNKIKKIQIKEAAEPSATVDDIKASVMGLRLGCTSPNSGIKKATSSQSLNMILSPTPPVERRRPYPGASGQSFDDTNISSLLDIEISLPSEIPAPLLPTTTYNPSILLGTDLPDPTATLLPWSLPGVGDGTAPPLIPTLASTSHQEDQKEAGNETGQQEAAPRPKPVPRPRTNSSPSVSPEVPRRRNAGSNMVHPNLPPPVPSKRKTTSSLGKVEETGEASQPGDKDATTPATTTTTDDTSTPMRASASTPALGGLASGDSQQGTKSAESSPKLEPKRDIILTPPIPAPRRGSGSNRRRVSPNADALGASISPLATTKLSAVAAAATSPLANGVGGGATRSVSPGPVTSPALSPIPSAQSKMIPLAVAFRETCNALFKGGDLSQCVAKVTGEMVMSFPANYVSQLGSCDALQFRLNNADGVERVLHNQHLLKREADSFSYSFNMPALAAHFKQLAERNSAPFYNIQVFKYEVKVQDGSQLPLKLVCFWKCEPTVTNFRLDYTYLPSLLHPSSPPGKPVPLSGVTVSVPVGGGVTNALSKPNGAWSGKQNLMLWKIGDLQPQDQPASSPLHAKFEVSVGPSVPAPTTVQFACDGASLSGLSLELTSASYHVSLLKNKCSAGRYVAEIIK